MQQKALENFMHRDKLSWNDKQYSEIDVETLHFILYSFLLPPYWHTISNPSRSSNRFAKIRCKLKSPKDKPCLKISLEIIHKFSVKISLSIEDFFFLGNLSLPFYFNLFDIGFIAQKDFRGTSFCCYINRNCRLFLWSLATSTVKTGVPLELVTWRK